MKGARHLSSMGRHGPGVPGLERIRVAAQAFAELAAAPCVGLDHSGEDGIMVQRAARGERGRPLDTMRKEFRHAVDVTELMIELGTDTRP